jgi:hypothetical protein
MISNVDIAKQISELMLSVFGRLDESIDLVKATCSPEEASKYQKKIARVLGPIVMDVLEPLYEENPALKPANWDGGWPPNDDKKAG